MEESSYFGMVYAYVSSRQRCWGTLLKTYEYAARIIFYHENQTIIELYLSGCRHKHIRV